MLWDGNSINYRVGLTSVFWGNNSTRGYVRCMLSCTNNEWVPLDHELLISNFKIFLLFSCLQDNFIICIVHRVVKCPLNYPDWLFLAIGSVFFCEICYSAQLFLWLLKDRYSLQRVFCFLKTK